MGCSASHAAQFRELVPVGASIHIGTWSRPTGTQQEILCLKVISASFDRNLQKMGGTYCLVSMKEVDGLTWEIARTRTSWGGSSAEFYWDHVCRGVLYRGAKKQDTLHFQVLEKNWLGIAAATCLGEATITANELISDDTAAGSWGTERTLVLKTGTITVQAGINVAEAAETGQTVTPVDAQLFEMPVKPVAKLSSVAATEHYALRLKKPIGTPVDYWLGKDARCAAAEISFYEKCRKLAKDGSPPKGSVKPVVGHLLDYAGVVDVPAVEGQAAGGRPVQMLALQNLLASFESARMLDLKMGEVSLDGTFVKSKIGYDAMMQAVTDGLSMTASEGFRVEAFSGPPESLESRNPLVHTVAEDNPKMCEKAKRIMLQRLTGSQIFMYYADMHGLAGSSSSSSSALRGAEFAEIVLGETVVKLCKYAIACREIEAPQRFVHSSVGLAFDCRLPSRDVSEATIRQGVRVKPFSFEDSDICSLEEYKDMGMRLRKERAGNWRQYRGGLDRLSWEATRAYENTFGNSSEWKDVVAKVKDFDGANPDDFIGQVRIPLKNCQDQVACLCDKNWKPIVGRGQDPTLTYSAQWHDYATGSRLRGAWAITIGSAANLPALDKVLASSDPYVKISASSTAGRQCFAQTTAVVMRNLNPQWNETFELPLAEPTGTPALVSLLDSVHPGLGSSMNLQEVLLPADKGIEEKAASKAVRLWQEQLTACKAVVSEPLTPMTPITPLMPLTPRTPLTPLVPAVGGVPTESPVPSPTSTPYQSKVAQEVIIEEVAEPKLGRCGCKAA